MVTDVTVIVEANKADTPSTIWLLMWLSLSKPTSRIRHKLYGYWCDCHCRSQQGGHAINYMVTDVTVIVEANKADTP